MPQKNPVQKARKPKPPFTKQYQKAPGLESKLKPRPKYKAPAYKAADKLIDQIALITGGDSGIGRAVAVLYAREGADVAITYLPEERTDAEETQVAVDLQLKDINLMRDPPAVDLEVKLTDFLLQELNSFLLVNGPFTFAQGQLSLSSELAIKDDKIVGYVKPQLRDVKMIANQERFVSLRHGLNEFLLGFANLILRSNENSIDIRDVPK